MLTTILRCLLKGGTGLSSDLRLSFNSVPALPCSFCQPTSSHFLLLEDVQLTGVFNVPFLKKVRPKVMVGPRYPILNPCFFRSPFLVPPEALNELAVSALAPYPPPMTGAVSSPVTFPHLGQVPPRFYLTFLYGPIKKGVPTPPGLAAIRSPDGRPRSPIRTQGGDGASISTETLSTSTWAAPPDSSPGPSLFGSWFLLVCLIVEPYRSSRQVLFCC